MGAPLVRSPRLFASGERVEPGIYRDVETGVTVRLLEADELPDTVQIVRVSRRFRLVSPDDEPAARAAC